MNYLLAQVAELEAQDSFIWGLGLDRRSRSRVPRLWAKEGEWTGWQSEGVPRRVGVPTVERAKERAEKAKSADEIARKNFKKGELRMRHAGRSV